MLSINSSIFLILFCIFNGRMLLGVDNGKYEDQEDKGWMNFEKTEVFYEYYVNTYHHHHKRRISMLNERIILFPLTALDF